MSEKDIANLLAILDSANKVLTFTKDVSDADTFYQDIKTFDSGQTFLDINIHLRYLKLIYNLFKTFSNLQQPLIRPLFGV